LDVAASHGEPENDRRAPPSVTVADRTAAVCDAATAVRAAVHGHTGAATVLDGKRVTGDVGLEGSVQWGVGGPRLSVTIQRGKTQCTGA